MIFKPQLVALDSSHWEQWISDSYSSDASDRASAAAFHQSLMEMGFTVLFSMHHLVELMAHGDFCSFGLAVTREMFEGLRLGVEVFHQSADSLDTRASTSLGFGLTYDLNENYHLLAYGGPGLQNAGQVGRYNWYLSTLFTF